jgi:hypothetical protein
MPANYVKVGMMSIVQQERFLETNRESVNTRKVSVEANRERQPNLI